MIDTKSLLDLLTVNESDKKHNSLKVFKEFIKEENFKLTQEWFVDKDDQKINDAELHAEFGIWLEKTEYKNIRIKRKNEFYSLLIAFRRRQNKLNFHKVKARLAGKKADQARYDNALLKLQSLTGWSNIDILVLEGWMWAVKKAVWTGWLEEKDVPLIVFYSPQLTQKTSFVRALVTSALAPLVKWCWQNVLTDKFVRRAFLSDNLVCIFDELAGFKGAKMDSINALLTSREWSHRIMRSENVITSRRLCQFIATSQRRIDQIFPDQTGNRHFYQIELKQPLKKLLIACGYDEAKQTVKDDSLIMDLWRRLNLKETPEFFSEAFQKKYQHVVYQKYRKLTVVEEWFLDRPPDTGDHRFKCNELYGQFKERHEESTGKNTTLTKMAFSKLVRTKLDKYIEYVSSKNSNRTYYRVYNHMEPEEAPMIADDMLNQNNLAHMNRDNE